MKHRPLGPALRLALYVVSAGLAAGSVVAQVANPSRKVGWWQMAAHLPHGTTMTRNLCLDRDWDARHPVFGAKAGCTMTGRTIAGGFAYQKSCGGETTNGTAIGNFNSAYKITEQRGSIQIHTDSRWMGACPAGRKPGELWFQ